MTVCKNDNGDKTNRLTTMLKMPISCTISKKSNRKTKKDDTFEFKEIGKNSFTNHNSTNDDVTRLSILDFTVSVLYIYLKL